VTRFALSIFEIQAIACSAAERWFVLMVNFDLAKTPFKAACLGVVAVLSVMWLLLNFSVLCLVTRPCEHRDGVSVMAVSLLSSRCPSLCDVSSSCVVC